MTDSSARLQALVELVVAGRPMADVGTDHARLPIAAVASGRVPSAIASDVAPGPLARARAAIAGAGLATVDLRQGDGLGPLAPGEVATVVIAGMGGARIRRLVDAAPEVVDRVERLVLQPNTEWIETRRWIAQCGLALVDERLVLDAGRFYLMLALDPRPPRASRSGWDEVDLVLGPIVRRRRDPAFRAWVARRRARIERALGRARAGARDHGGAVEALQRQHDLLALA